ncbi:MAG: hypothetical protein JW837_14160 [Sedimentisphaerales bacterium]|nr:hypothetical protein [Sedimentisphaerales bacterium]
MNNDDKNEYDAWTCLRDHAWHEFEEKTRTEWRLSFGIWAAVLSSAGAVLSADQLKGSTGFTLSAYLAVVIIIYIHARFLAWIQSCLSNSRDVLRQADTSMRGLLHQDPRILGPRRPAWRQPSVQVQMLITILVSITLLLVIHALPAG